MGPGLYVVKGISRVIVRIVLDIIHRLTLNIFDSLFGAFNWPRKRLRIKILILRNEDTEKTPSVNDLDEMINYTKRSFIKNFNVEVLQAGESFTEVLQRQSPKEALYTKGGSAAFNEEFKITGNFFASNLTVPIYPVTIFIVKDIKGADGCSLGPMSDYVTIDHNGLKNDSVLAHELAHACGLWHLHDKKNLLFTDRTRGDKVRWWQKNIFRSSRHITYW